MMKVKDIAQAIIKERQHKLDDLQIAVLLPLLFLERDPPDELKKVLKHRGVNIEIDTRVLPFTSQIFKDRLREYGIESSQSLAFFVSTIADRPGTAILYATVAKYACDQLGKTTLNVTEFVEHFPDGFPNNESLEKIWDMQKVGGANSVDYPKAWE